MDDLRTRLLKNAERYRKRGNMAAARKVEELAGEADTIMELEG